MPRITIDSILGGRSPATHFATKDQFLASLGIDPGLSILQNPLAYFGSGLLVPKASSNNGAGVLQNAPLWIKTQPKTSINNIFVYDAQGSVYTVDKTGVLTALAVAQDMTQASGNGCEYYDNYMYFARNTSIARYGPLNGAPTFISDYWMGVLGKPDLTHTSYPQGSISNIRYPNHILHRHSDGKLYIADVVGNKGTIHFIQTTNTSGVEGDTDNGSTASKLTFGFGLWPTAMESYGSNLAIALCEDANGILGQMPAKLAFWDTGSANFNQITWVEFPDRFITALKNINGILYVTSGNGLGGFRVSRFVGGYTFQEIAYFETGDAPFAGGIDGQADQLVFASNSIEVYPNTSPCVYSVGLQRGSLSKGLFNIMRGTSGSASAAGVALAYSNLASSNVTRGLLLGWSTGAVHGIDDTVSGVYGQQANVFWSQIFKIGQKFKITKIRFPLGQAIGANMIVTPKIYVDEGATSYIGGIDPGLAIINNANYPGIKNVVMRPVSATGEHNFWLELKWTGTALCVLGLPITIEYILLDD